MSIFAVGTELVGMTPQEKAKWYKLYGARAGQDEAALPNGGPPPNGERSGCRFAVANGRAVACCRIRLPDGTPLTLTATAPVEPLRKALEEKTGSSVKAHRLARTAAKHVAAVKLARKVRAARGDDKTALAARVQKVQQKAAQGDPKAQIVAKKIHAAARVAARARAGDPGARGIIAKIAAQARGGHPKAKQAAKALAIATKLRGSASWRGGWNMGWEPYRTSLATASDGGRLASWYRSGLTA